MDALPGHSLALTACWLFPSASLHSCVMSFKRSFCVADWTLQMILCWTWKKKTPIKLSWRKNDFYTSASCIIKGKIIWCMLDLLGCMKWRTREQMDFIAKHPPKLCSVSNPSNVFSTCTLRYCPGNRLYFPPPFITAWLMTRIMAQSCAG